jgi:hypothetical protein
MTLIAIESEALLSVVQQMESGMIVGPSLAKDLRVLVTAAKPAADPALAAELYAALSNFPCSCIETGSWPRFKADVKAHPERTCRKHAAMRAWEKANNLEPKP